MTDSALSVLTGKRVLVTGGAGFLGSFVCEQLHACECAEITIPRTLDYDLVCIDAVRDLYFDSKPDVVIHLAARIPELASSEKTAGEIFYENTMMGIQLLEEARIAGVRKFVSVAGIDSYPANASLPLKEEDFWNGYPANPAYGISKKLLLTQAQAYREQYKFNSIFLIPAELYGPSDNSKSSRFIPSLIASCLAAAENNATSVSISWKENAVQEFLYVEDCAEAIVLATAQYDSAYPVNISSGEKIALKDLAKLVAQHTGFKGDFSWSDSNPKLEQWLDSSRASELFGFSATTMLDQGLQKTISHSSPSLTSAGKYNQPAQR